MDRGESKRRFAGFEMNYGSIYCSLSCLIFMAASSGALPSSPLIPSILRAFLSALSLNNQFANKWPCLFANNNMEDSSDREQENR